MRIAFVATLVKTLLNAVLIFGLPFGKEPPHIILVSIDTLLQA